MANIEYQNLLVAVKSFARAQALPLDRDEVWESLSAAEEYMQSPTAYAGQTIKVLMGDGKYRAYTLQPSTGGLGLEMEEITGSGSIDPSQLKQYVQIVDVLPEENQVQGVIYVLTTENAGYIWTGVEYKQIFRDVETDISNLKSQKADLNGAIFTGEVLLAADPTQDLGAATKQYVDKLVSNISILTPGIVDSQNPLPEEYKAGQTWRVVELGIYADHACEAGDLIIALADGTEILAENFLVVQANIDGAVTGPEPSIDATLVVFNGTTGKKIAGSNVTIASVEEAVAMKHSHENLDILNSFTKTQDELEKFIEDSAESVKNELQPLINAKIGQSELESAIAEIRNEVQDYTDDKIGLIPEGTTVKEYVDNAVGSGGTDAADAIATAKAEAIQASKDYTDEQTLTVLESAQEYTNSALEIRVF